MFPELPSGTVGFLWSEQAKSALMSSELPLIMLLLFNKKALGVIKNNQFI
jgi:hypothetical protein